MSQSLFETNIVALAGKMISSFKLSHEIYGEKFYFFFLEVQRLSEVKDMIPVTISERLLGVKKPEEGAIVKVEGQLRSYNNYGKEGNKLILTVFAREIVLPSCDTGEEHYNRIYLDGYLCKKPLYRTTPFGREIADILLAVNRPYNKSDYIPCVAWGRNARYSENMSVGDNVKVWGRIQSREYQKKCDSGEVLSKIAYEVSIAKMEIFKE